MDERNRNRVKYRLTERDKGEKNSERTEKDRRMLRMREWEDELIKRVEKGIR